MNIDKRMEKVYELFENLDENRFEAAFHAAKDAAKGKLDLEGIKIVGGRGSPNKSREP